MFQSDRSGVFFLRHCAKDRKSEAHEVPAA